MVDLPGFYPKAESDDRALRGSPIVNHLAENKMMQENTIILAVISTKCDLNKQRAVEEARKHDPSGKRTLGVITKLDMLKDNSQSQDKYTSFVRNEDDKYTIPVGW